MRSAQIEIRPFTGPFCHLVGPLKSCYIQGINIFLWKNMIQISEPAAKKLKNLREEENKDPSYFLRVEVKKGGCSGLSYKMEFDNTPRAGDKTFEMNGEKLVVDGQSFLYLIGMTLDFSGGLNGKGFIFNNPNASKSCGCGASFNV